MASLPDNRLMTPEEFLDWERQQEGRFEYIEGIIRPLGMVGGTLRHSLLAGNLHIALRRQLAGRGCRAYQEGVKVAVGRRFYYPDIAASCAPFLPDADTVESPFLLAEVTSPSSLSYDRAEKWFAYQTIPGLQAYLLIAQDQVRVEVWRRSGAGWEHAVITDPDATAVALEAPPLVLTVAEIYEDSRLGPPP